MLDDKDPIDEPNGKTLFPRWVIKGETDMLTVVSLVTDANDFQACIAVRAAAFISRGEPYKEEYDGNDFVCATHLLAKQKSEPVGTMRIRLLTVDNGGVAVWERLAVSPVANRGIGVLNTLANTAMAYTQFKGCHKVLGGVADPRLMRFWKKRGFTEVDKPPVIYNETEYIQIMLELTPNSPKVDLQKASLGESSRFQTALEKGKRISAAPNHSCA